MKVKVEELKPKYAALLIEGTETYFVNALRRIMLAELPKLAVEDVIIYDNTSALFDEIIAHRLGLVPIPTDLSLLTFRDECVCKGKGCPNCTVRYTLSKEGAGMVLSGDLQPSEPSWAITEANIPLVELFDDQRLILEVEAVLGSGRDHAKWQAVQAPGYTMMPSIEVDKKREDDVKEFVKDLPQGIVTLKDDGTLELTDIKKLPVFEAYLERKKVDYITVKKDPTRIRFKLETDGSLTAKDAVIESAKILEEKFKEFGTLLKDLK
jgi:DNA-directed RNA polymerase subunit D